MPKYECPECQAVLRRAEAIPTGKKIRCPKCEAVFAAQPMAEDEEPAKEPAAGYAVAAPTPAPPKKTPTYEDEDSSPYTVIKESGEEVKPEIHLGSLRDRFAKSAIGPAMFRTVLPSNWLLRCGLLTCLLATFFFINGGFPIIFCEATTSRPFIRPKMDTMLEAVFLFACGGIMCIGTARLHDLTSFPWAIVGSVTAVPGGILTAHLTVKFFDRLDLIPTIYLVGVFYVIIVGYSAIALWCLIMTLLPDIRAGFKERAEELETMQ